MHHHHSLTPAGNRHPLLKRGLLLLVPLLCQSVRADLRTDLTGYYSFEAETAGTVSNSARTLGLPGFDNDGAKLNGGDAVEGTVPLTNAPGVPLAGTGALAGDGDGDYANLSVAPVTTDVDFTVSIWFKPQTGGSGITGATRAFVFESEPAYALSFGLRAGSAGMTNFQLFADLSVSADQSFGYEIPNAEVDQWHHLVLTYSMETGLLEGYLDGELRYQLTIAEPLSSIAGFHTGTYRAANGRYFKGFIDEQVFWQRALSPEEAVAMHAGGTAAKSFATLSGEAANLPLRTGLTAYYSYDTHIDRLVSNDAVALGAPGYDGDAADLNGDYSAPETILQPLTNEASQARAGTRALLCDGINNYAAIDGNPVDSTQSWTVSAWFKPDTSGQGYGSAATRAFIYESGVNYPISFSLRGAVNFEDTTFQMFSQLNTGAAVSISVDRPNTELDQWHHFAQVHDAAAGTVSGYLDGVEVFALSTLVEEIPVPLQTYTGFRLGTYRAADGRWFNGLIDEVGMWQRPLAAGEIGLLYGLGSAGLALPSAGTAGELAVTGFAAVAGAPGSYQLTWSTVAGLKYAVEASDDLTDWSTTLAEEIPATGDSLSFRIVPALPAPAGALYDPGAGGVRRFYRVRLKF